MNGLAKSGKNNEHGAMRAKTSKQNLEMKARLKPAKYPLPVIAAPSVVPVKQRRLVFGHRWDYAPAPETAPVKIEPRQELFIDGKFVAHQSGHGDQVVRDRPG
jgi:hypothetical protein